MQSTLLWLVGETRVLAFSSSRTSDGHNEMMLVVDKALSSWVILLRDRSIFLLVRCE